MMIRTALTLLIALFLGLVAVTADAQQAADTKKPKEVTVRNLVTSLGGFSATVNAPVFVTGSTVEIAPGGHTGRQQFRVPTYIYVIQGTLTTEYDSGPVGIAGAQYHAAGQSFMDNGGWWHNHFNRTDKPVKYLILHIGYPGRPDPILRPEADD
jgi:quercetin dioxygenase-like cupin family protein